MSAFTTITTSQLARSCFLVKEHIRRFLLISLTLKQQSKSNTKPLYAVQSASSTSFILSIMSGMTPAGEKAAGLKYMVSKMKSAEGGARDNGFTLGWNIVASYSEREINKLLADRYARLDKTNRMVKEITGMKVKVKDQKTRKWLSRHYSVKFEAPLIQFHGASAREPSCELIMPITEGFFTETPEGQEPAPGAERYPIADSPNSQRVRIMGIPLGTVTGKYQDIKDQSAGGQTRPKIKSAENPVVFDRPSTEAEGRGQVAYVVLDLPLGDGLQIAVEPNNKTEDASEDARALEGPLKNFFSDPTKIDVIEYALVRVNNDQPAGSNDLVPDCFQMATFASHDFPDSVLSLFIKVRGSNDSGQLNNLQQKWAGQWTLDRINACPIPKGYTASIIMNPNLVYEKLLKTGMQGAYNCSDKRLGDRQDGISWTAAPKKKWVVGWFSHRYRQNNDDSVLEVDGWEKDFKDEPMRIDLKQIEDAKAKDGPVAYIKWTFKTRAKWDDSSKDTKWWNFGNRALYTSGEVETSWSLDRDFPCKVTMNDDRFELVIDTADRTLADRFWTATHAQVPGSGGILDFLIIDPPDDAKAEMLKKIGNITPSLDIKSMGLGFLRTTNLLMPGSKVIKFDREAGVRVPRDLIMVGKVAQLSDV
ncbi:MAG: hypothetical protein MMC33_002713 [Icmadophila ericetorum]|nr:hypothetical protein [Icmadophila ericetorum]